MSQIRILIVRPKNPKRVAITALIEAIAAELERAKFAGEYKTPVRSTVVPEEPIITSHIGFFDPARVIHLRIDLTEEGLRRASGLGDLDWDYLSRLHDVVQVAVATQFQSRTPPPTVVMAYQGYNVARWGETAD